MTSEKHEILFIQPNLYNIYWIQGTMGNVKVPGNTQMSKIQALQTGRRNKNINANHTEYTKEKRKKKF